MSDRSGGVSICLLCTGFTRFSPSPHQSGLSLLLFARSLDLNAAVAARDGLADCFRRQSAPPSSGGFSVAAHRLSLGGRVRWEGEL